MAAAIVGQFHAGDLRINKQPDRGRERRPACHFGQAGDTERAAEPDIAGEHAPRGFGNTVELAAAASEH